MEGNPNKWLLYANNEKWMGTDAESKGANNNLGVCHSVVAGLAHPTMAKEWTVLIACSEWQPQPVSASLLVGPLEAS